MRNYSIKDISDDHQHRNPSISLPRIEVSGAARKYANIQLAAGMVAMTESLITGYQKMGQLNSEIAQEYLSCEIEVANMYLEH